VVIFVLPGLLHCDRSVLVYFAILLVLSTFHNSLGFDVNPDFHWTDIRLPHDKAIQATHRTICGNNKKNHNSGIFSDLF
jgi:hypothetical protein